MLDDLLLPDELGLVINRWRFNYENYYAGDINSKETEPDVNVESEESTSEPILEQT